MTKKDINRRSISYFVRSRVFWVFGCLFWAAPAVSFAGAPPNVGGSGAPDSFRDLVENYLIALINEAFIPLVFAVSLAVFLWGVYRYYFASGDKEKNEARNFVVYGLIGFFVMVSVWGLVRIVYQTFFGPLSYGGGNAPPAQNNPLGGLPNTYLYPSPNPSSFPGGGGSNTGGSGPGGPSQNFADLTLFRNLEEVKRRIAENSSISDFEKCMATQGISYIRQIIDARGQGEVYLTAYAKTALVSFSGRLKSENCTDWTADLSAEDYRKGANKIIAYWYFAHGLKDDGTIELDTQIPWVSGNAGLDYLYQCSNFSPSPQVCDPDK